MILVLRHFCELKTLFTSVACVFYVCCRSISALTILFLVKTCNCQESLELVPGDVTIGAMFSVNNIRNAGCGDYDVDTLKDLTAVKWFLDTVNSMNYIPGVAIGEIGRLTRYQIDRQTNRQTDR